MSMVAVGYKYNEMGMSFFSGSMINKYRSGEIQLILYLGDKNVVIFHGCVLKFMRFNILVEAEIEFARQCIVAKLPLGFVLINFPGLLFLLFSL